MYYIIRHTTFKGVCSLKVQGMPHAILLRFEITLVVGIRGGFDGNVLGNFESVSLKSYAFYGIVGEQTHFAYSQHT